MATSSETKQIVDNPYSTNIDRNLIFSAKIGIVYIITVQQPENGCITVNDEVGTTFMYSEGTPVDIQAVPNEGYDAVLYVDDYDAPMLISFTLTGYELTTATYQAEEGMSINEWFKSSYNTSGLTEWLPKTDSSYDYYYWYDSLGNSYSGSEYGLTLWDYDVVTFQDGVTYTRYFYED